MPLIAFVPVSNLAMFASREQAYWRDFFADIDCCVTPVLRVDEAVEHAHFVARGMTVQADGVCQYAPPVKLSGWVFAVERAAPSAGEHSAEILSAAGFSSEEIGSLQEGGVI
jgi:crotonobetainyl-CoA:carnitine CoA-transferase CaiB-like acyl-CoA transferase